MIDQKGLKILINEAAELSVKPHLTEQEKRRNTYLMSAIAAVKAGAQLADLDEERANETLRNAGLPTIKRNKFITREQEAEARGWQSVVANAHLSLHEREQRDMTEGNPISRIGTYSGLGYFVPTGFFPKLFAALSAHDVLFDENSGVTMIKTTTAEPITVPTVGDIENVAAVVGENTQTTSVDLSVPGHAVVGAWKYTTWDSLSREAFQDMDSTISAVNLFSANFAVRFARGIGKDLVTGSGSSKPLGLIPSLLAAGISPIVASGSATNDGSTNTGSNSLGSEDFQTALQNLDDAYANSPSCAWLMNKKTLATVAGQLDKYGNVLRLVEYVNGAPYIFGIPVRICPSMDNVGNSKNPVVLGDLRYWCTRLVVDASSGIQVINEASGLVEYGKVGLRAFMRADGELLYSDTSSPAPFVIISNHS
jgi:HK97 family phage major capsid protein